MPRHIRKGDTVMVTSGSFKGQMGEVTRIITKTNQVLVKGVNLHTKHVKPSRENQQGGVISKELPLDLGRVSPVVDGKPVRVGFRFEPDGSKVRVARHAGKELKILNVIHGPRGEAKAEGKKTKTKKKAKTK